MPLRAIYEEHADALFSLAVRLMGSEADAEDVVQDVFLGLPRALRSYRGDGSFAAWLRVVTTRQALMALRTRRRRQETGLASQALQVAGSAGVDRLDSLWLENEMEALPDHLRVVLVLRLEGYAHAEIAGLLGIAKATSMGRLTKAKAALREAMDR
ncbi:MAG: RNA polymerase sigma factor [Gemmatimonadota bacterium]